ncbi:hypothetical protein E3983_03755 [Legionella israelensis]|uniref:Major Facilitator Superfamily protein n=1 Tax=Legionella israelensis TaxID=454 RepID=A0AAX1EEQ0_9GAMM|nr:hypothetical protein [Legionella israelensis]QBR83549.1 hypothetical protein E3983_03755 [Legionella israelensis]
MTIVSFWLLQVIMHVYKTPMLVIGLIWFVYHAISGFFSSKTSSLFQKLKRKKLFLLLPSLLLLMFLTLGLISSSWILPVIFLAAVVFGIKMPFIYLELNTTLPSSLRASILSLDSLLTRVIFAFLAMIVGYSLNNYSVYTVFFLLTIPLFMAFWIVAKIRTLAELSL